MTGDTFRTSAVSSTLKPPKNRSSTTLRLSRIDASKSLQSIVEHDQIFSPISADDGCVFQSNVLDAATAFQVVAPCVVNQNPSHELRRNGEEVGAVLPAHALVVHQPQVSFVDQGSGLQTVAGSVPGLK